MKFYEIEDTNILRKVVGWIVDIVVVLYLAGFVIYSFGFQVPVSGQSMLPVLNSEDVVIINQIIYKFREAERFDVVVFRRDDQKFNIKRIIGLPGEEIQIKSGSVFVNGVMLGGAESLQRASLAGLAEAPVVLGKDEFFVLGDNREGSEDSRFINIGNVKKEQIIGKVWFRIYPFIDLGWID